MVNAAVVVAVLAGWNWLSADEVEPLESTDVGKSWGGGGGGQPLREGGGGVDMSATFAKYKSCDACIAAGYGWCPPKQKCGGARSRPILANSRRCAARRATPFRRWAWRRSAWRSLLARDYTRGSAHPCLVSLPPCACAQMTASTPIAAPDSQLQFAQLA